MRCAYVKSDNTEDKSCADRSASNNLSIYLSIPLTSENLSPISAIVENEIEPFSLKSDIAELSNLMLSDAVLMLDKASLLLSLVASFFASLIFAINSSHENNVPSGTCSLAAITKSSRDKSYAFSSNSS